MSDDGTMYPKEDVMTVGELINELQNLPDDMEVRFTYDYGDHCHSIIAGKINEIKISNIKYSDYHTQDIVCDEDEDGKEVVILQ